MSGANTSNRPSALVPTAKGPNVPSPGWRSGCHPNQSPAGAGSLCQRCHTVRSLRTTKTSRRPLALRASAGVAIAGLGPKWPETTCCPPGCLSESHPFQSTAPGLGCVACHSPRSLPPRRPQGSCRQLGQPRAHRPTVRWRAPRWPTAAKTTSGRPGCPARRATQDPGTPFHRSHAAGTSGRAFTGRNGQSALP